MLSQIVGFKHQFFSFFLACGLIFGVILYERLDLNYTDELMACILFFYASLVAWKEHRYQDFKPVLLLISIFIFYILYSFCIHANTPAAILSDAVCEIKPFLAFYAVILLSPKLSARDNSMLTILGLIASCFLLIIGLVDTHFNFFVHYSRYATGVICTFLLLLLCCNYSWKNVMLLLLVLSLGFFSTRSKFYGFWTVTVLLLTYFKYMGSLRMKWSFFFFLLFVLCVAAWVAREKIIIYYVDGMLSSREMWSRPAMMLTSLQILVDYFPLGSGLATIGSFASAQHYSHIYVDYGLDGLWGLTRQNPMYVCDSYIPVLAQFGIVGLVLYIWFWAKILLTASRKLLPRWQLVVWLIFIFFLIEAVADTTFTHNRGLFVMLILGYVFTQQSSHSHASAQP